MLKDFAGSAGPAPWAIASMLLFIFVFVGVALRIWSMTSEEGAARARIPLDDEAPTTTQDASGGDNGQI